MRLALSYLSSVLEDQKLKHLFTGYNLVCMQKARLPQLEIYVVLPRNLMKNMDRKRWIEEKVAVSEKKNSNHSIVTNLFTKLPKVLILTVSTSLRDYADHLQPIPF